MPEPGSRPGPERKSALSGVLVPGDFGAVGFRGPGISISGRHPLSLVQVECRTEQASALHAALQQSLRLDAIAGPGSATGNGRHRILCTGPCRWLVISLPASAPGTAFRHAVAAAQGAIVELSHGRTVVRISGRSVRTLLMKGGSLDWHARSFPVDSCAQTLLFHLSVLVDCRDHDVFEIHVARSYARSLFHHLADAAAEYGYRVID